MKTHCQMFEEWWQEEGFGPEDKTREQDWYEQIELGLKSLRDLAESAFMQGIRIGRSEK